MFQLEVVRVSELSNFLNMVAAGMLDSVFTMLQISESGC